MDRSTAARVMAVRLSVECNVLGWAACHEQKSDASESEGLIYNSQGVQSVLNMAGERIISPFAANIRRATRIRVIVPIDLLEFPIDGLYVYGKPLFLQKPIAYAIERNVTPAKFTARRASSALLISDRSSDPQRAVFGIAELFHRAEKLDASRVDTAKLRFTRRWHSK